MSAATVAAQIGRLEALGKTRALDHGESRQLQKMIATERRYASMKLANAAARARDEEIVYDREGPR